jgi:hypothetical protein
MNRDTNAPGLPEIKPVIAVKSVDVVVVVLITAFELESSSFW